MASSAQPTVAPRTVPSPVRRPELLAPAGDWDCVRAAVENGADAVYFGLERFNARMRAKNFTVADLPALMTFLHRRGVRAYVTFNTLVFTNELADAEAYLKGIIAAGVDAAIVQDVGMCRMIRALSPDFPIHASTQMTVTSAAGVDFARELGANLVVLARENSLADIGRINAAQAGAAAPLPLEVFVHGALCVAFSGQCLTSESLGGRSANRGECAQACRLPYDLVSDGQPVDLGDRRYLLSPQDLSGLDVLPELVRAGVVSLKIEGRLKSPEYVASITRVYRQALDKVMLEAASTHVATRPFRKETEAVAGVGDPECRPQRGQPQSEAVSAQRAKYELEMSFSRGLFTGWFRGIDNRALVHARFGTKRGVFLGTVEKVDAESVSLRLQSPLRPGDGVVFDRGRPEEGEEGGRVYQVDAGRDGLALLRFGHGDIDWRRVQAGQLLWKTSDPALEREVRATFAGEKPAFTRPIRLEIHGAAGTPLTLVAHDEAGHSARAESALPLAAATSQPLNAETLRAQLGRLGGTPFHLGELENQLEGDLMLPFSELNRVRRTGIARLEELRAQPPRWVLHEKATLPPLPSRPAPAAPELIAVIRQRDQLEPAWSAGCRTIYCEFENPKHYRETVVRFRELLAETQGTGHKAQDTGQISDPAVSGALCPLSTGSIWVAPPRIFLPGEEWILQQVQSCEADGYLVRNPDHLRFFAGDRRRGDFSLNIANPWAAAWFIDHHGLERVTASYDLNTVQLDTLLRASPPAWYDITLHQRMPMFHMNHCVFCAFLSEGKDYRDCGRPCDHHAVALRDRVGAELPLKADAGCRNTVYNNRAQTGAEFLGPLLGAGARSFRVEFVTESPAEVARTLTSYRRLLAGEITGTDLWRELKLINQLGVTRGQLAR
jgi:putative protease